MEYEKYTMIEDKCQIIVINSGLALFANKIGLGDYNYDFLPEIALITNT